MKFDFDMENTFFLCDGLSDQPEKIFLSPSSLTKVLYFDRPEYGSALANEWSDYDLLMMNIRMGCKRTVEDLINFGCRIEKPGKHGTSLSTAVKNGWTNIAKKMLDQGARVCDADWNVNSPLRCAFIKKKLMDAEYLINAMLDKYLMETKANFVHEDGLSFFHIACAKGDVKFVKEFLLGGRVIVDAQVSNSAKRYPGYSALHFAVKFKRDDVVQLLIKHGVNLHVQDVNGSTALHLAFYEENWEAVDCLLSADRDKKDVANSSGLTHFMIACTVADSIQAEQFLWKARRLHGINGPSILIFNKVNSPTRRSIPSFVSYSPLHFAAMFGRLNTVRLLLNYHANCCAMNGNWHTPAEVARANGYLEVCRVLEKYCIESQAAIDNMDDSGYDTMSSSNASANYSLVNARRVSWV